MMNRNLETRLLRIEAKTDLSNLGRLTDEQLDTETERAVCLFLESFPSVEAAIEALEASSSMDDIAMAPLLKQYVEEWRATQIAH